MDLFNRQKVKLLEEKITNLNCTVKIRNEYIANLERDLAPYVTYKQSGKWNKKYTLLESEKENLELKLYISVLEGELGLEKTEIAKNKCTALSELTEKISEFAKNNTLIGGD